MINILVNAAGIIVFLYLFWRRLKEDYSGQIIFSSAFSILLGMFFGSLIASKISHQWFFWGGFLGVVVGFLTSVLRFRIRIYETCEAIVLSFLPYISFIFLADSVFNSSFVSFLGFIVMLFLIFIYFLLDAKYRDFSWYRSGKIGFSGLATLGTFFLIRSGVAIFFHSVLSFVGKSEIYISGILAFISFLLIFNLGRQQ